MTIMWKSITLACIILVLSSSSSISDAFSIAAASFTTNRLFEISTSCADIKSSLAVARSSSRSNIDISRYWTIRKKRPILSLAALSNDANGNNKKKKQLQQPGFHQIGGPIQPSIANQFSKEDIVTLLRNRTKARRDRHFSRADEILQTLSDAGIFVNDSRKIWRADGFFSVAGGDDDDDTDAAGDTTYYVKSKKSKYISDDDTKHVLKRLEQRTEAKRNKDYMTADTIRDELRYLFHIEVNDSIKTWSVLGEEKSSYLNGDYVFGGKRVANIPEDDISAIEDLIKQRVEAKRRKDYVVADAILVDLKVRYSVRVDDKKKLWHLSPV